MTMFRRSAAVTALAALLGSGLAAAPSATAAPEASGAQREATPAAVAAVEPRVSRGPFFSIDSRATGAAGVDAVREGRQSLIRITHARARQRFVFDVDLPRGASLQRAGQGMVARAASGEVVAGLTPPWATDANGVRLATRFEIVDADTFVQVVEHRGIAAYPVVADPWWVVPVLLRAGGQVIKRQVTRASTRQAAMRIAKRQIARETAYQIEDLLANTGLQLKVLNARNFRENVRRRIGWSKAALRPYDAHHTLPRKFEEFFDDAGLNIHNPVFGHPWCRGDHQRRARAFNIDWGRFVERYEDRVRDDATSRRVIENYRIDIISKYSNGYQCQSGRALRGTEMWDVALARP